MNADHHQPTRRIAQWVKRFTPLIPPGCVLDLACGGGRNGRFLLEHWYKVTFVDRNISGVADLEQHPGATLLEYDLEAGKPWPFKPEQFSGIIAVNYLHRPLFHHLLNSLAHGGVLIYHTFSAGNERFGRPGNPDYLLKDNELIEVFGQALEVIDFEQGYKPDPDRVVQGICAVKNRQNRMDA